VVNLAEKTYSQLTEHQYHYVPFCNLAGLTFSDFQKVNPLSHPMWVHFGAFCYTRLGKKNAQNVGFEHFGRLWYSIYADILERRSNTTIKSIPPLISQFFSA
jgi:hypothetical protein